MNAEVPGHSHKNSKIANCLNQLTLINMTGIANSEALEDIIKDYFVFDSSENDENDGDSSESEIKETADQNKKQ